MQRIALQTLQLVRHGNTPHLLNKLSEDLFGIEATRAFSRRHEDPTPYACGFCAEKTKVVLPLGHPAGRTLLAREYLRALRYVARESLAGPVNGHQRQAARRFADWLQADSLDPFEWARRRREESGTSEVWEEVRARLDDRDFGYALLYWIGAGIRHQDELPGMESLLEALRSPD